MTSFIYDGRPSGSPARHLVVELGNYSSNYKRDGPRNLGRLCETEFPEELGLEAWRRTAMPRFLRDTMLRKGLGMEKKRI